MKVAFDENTTQKAVENLLSPELRSAQKAFRSGPNTFFLGAGVSCSEGLPGWKELLMALISDATGSKIEEKEFDALFEANGSSSIIMGRYIRRLYNDDNELMRKTIRRCLYKKKTYEGIRKRI